MSAPPVRGRLPLVALAQRVAQGAVLIVFFLRTPSMMSCVSLHRIDHHALRLSLLSGFVAPVSSRTGA